MIILIYSLSSLAINSDKDKFFNSEGITLEAKFNPLIVTTGNPDHRAKMPVEWYDWSRVMDEEHILPQNFTDEDIQTSRSETSKLIWRLGNLTILTPYVNNEANNDPVSDKYERDIFASSEYVLSKLLQLDYIESKPKGSKGQNKLLIRLGLSSIKLEENQYWTENQILEREQQFYNIFNEILFGIDEKLGKAEDILKVPKF